MEDVLAWMTGLAELIVMPLIPFMPLWPMKGEHPEVLAADEFFKRPRT